jgi:hypothetical protein
LVWPNIGHPHQRAGPLVPEQTAASVKTDIETIKEGMHQ